MKLIKIYFKVTDWQKRSNLNHESTVLPDTLPNTRSCYCIHIKDCKPLFELLLNRPVHPLIVDYLKNRTCGFVGKEPYVCCYGHNDPPPPNVQHPRVEKCMASDEATTANEIDNKHDTKLMPRFRPSNEEFDSSGYVPKSIRFSPNYNRYPYKPQRYPNPNNVHHENSLPKDKFPHNSHYFPPRYPHFPDRYPPHWQHFHPHFPENPNMSDDPMINSDKNNSKDGTSKENKKDEDSGKTRNNNSDNTCGISVEERVVGGTDVNIGTFPWIGRIGYIRMYSHLKFLFILLRN